MALSQDQTSRISEVVKDILLRRIETFPAIGAEIRNAPFHHAFLECFADQIGPLNLATPYLIAIASWMHGLNTSLGTGFESISHILSGGYKRTFANSFALPVKSTQASSLENIIRDLKAGNHLPDLQRENNLIFNFNAEDSDIISLGFTVDTFIEKPDEVIAIELKSVRPNSGEGRGEKQKILYGKAALRHMFPQKEIRFLIGFPFDPTSPTPTGYDKSRFFNYLVEFKKFFSADEVLIASELWDFLSGSTNTMEEVLEVIAATVRQIRGC